MLFVASKTQNIPGIFAKSGGKPQKMTKNERNREYEAEECERSQRCFGRK
jgi:hypothetical protein